MNRPVFTIGFTEKSASKFFGLLKSSGSKKLIDVRLNAKSQLAGFAKQADLAFFLKEICGIEYFHAANLAPTKTILDAYKRDKEMSWTHYAYEFNNLMAQRRIETSYRPSDLADACLLCSENAPHHCHRRLVVEYLNSHWDTQIEVCHLV